MLYVADLSIDRRTATRYLDLLEEMGLIHRLPGLRMKATDTERAVPKLHMADPILVAPDPGGVGDDRRGALLESFVVNELVTQLEWIGGADSLFHWRDRRRDEVDLVIKREGGFVAIEVKRAREVPPRSTAGINAFRDRYGERFRRGLVMYAGSHVLPLSDSVWAVPISTLWSMKATSQVGDTCLVLDGQPLDDAAPATRFGERAAHAAAADS